MRANRYIQKQISLVSRKEREQCHGHRSFVLWFTGLSGSGKSTLANAVEKRMSDLGLSTFVLDGDNVRSALCSDLGFSENDRTENIRRVGEVSKLFIEAGVITLVAFISPYQKDREKVRRLFSKNDFIEIYCNCSLHVCEQRDVKGLYSKARSGKVKNFTGIDSIYEPPLKPEVIINTEKIPLDVCVDEILNFLREKALIC